MASLPPATIAQLVLAQGASPNQAVVATAISLAEDASRDPAVQGDIGLEDATWGPSVGLFQVRSLKAETGTGQTRDADALTSPAFNVASAKSISNNWTNFGAWTTYTSGKYQAHIPVAMQAVAQAQNAPLTSDQLATLTGTNTPIAPPSGASGSWTPAPSPCNPPSGLGTLNPAGWIGFFWCKINSGNYAIRAFEGLAGGALMIVGLVLIGKEVGNATGATQAAKSGIQTGKKVVKTAKEIGEAAAAAA